MNAPRPAALRSFGAASVAGAAAAALLLFLVFAIGACQSRDAAETVAPAAATVGVDEAPAEDAEAPLTERMEDVQHMEGDDQAKIAAAERLMAEQQRHADEANGEVAEPEGDDGGGEESP